MKGFRDRFQRYKAARHIASILREHAPNIGLEPDKYGYVSMKKLVSIVKKSFDFITMSHLEEIVLKDAQNRFEICSGKIRTRTGHTYTVEVPSSPVVPPNPLYHGTSPEAAKSILCHGLLRAGKMFVHLTNTIERARHVGLRKSRNPIVLEIDIRAAMADGVRFWRSGQRSPDGEIYLSDEIPAKYISYNVTKETEGNV